jgi:hypothetical protein
MKIQGIALDRASVRSIDVDGRMRVARAAITIEQVAEYLGAELVGAEELGLDPTKVYRVYRPGEEIAKAAASSNSIQLLVRHIPVSADEPQTESIAGTTGSEAEYVAPYLFNSLSVWTAEAISLIESEKQKELSAGYRYRLVPESGVFDGQRYDFRMADLVFNHVALVERGRAGPTVVVGDSAIPLMEKVDMSKKQLPSRMSVLARGALLSCGPKFAQDKKPDIAALVKDVTAKNWLEKKPGIVAAVKAGLAQDTDIKDVVAIIEALDPVAADPVTQADDMPADPMAAATDDDGVAALKEQLAALAAKIEALGKPAAAQDESDEEKAKKEAEMKEKDKQAMDAAIKLASDATLATAIKQAKEETLKQARETREAEAFVRPYVGDLAIACDSAEAVYKAALDTLNVKVEGVPPAAYKHILAAQQKPGEQRRAHVALDAAPAADFAARFPGLSTIRQA